MWHSQPFFCLVLSWFLPFVKFVFVQRFVSCPIFSASKIILNLPNFSFQKGLAYSWFVVHFPSLNKVFLLFLDKKEIGFNLDDDDHTDNDDNDGDGGNVIIFQKKKWLMQTRPLDWFQGTSNIWPASLACLKVYTS